MITFLRRGLLVLTALAAVGCSLTNPPSCTQEFAYAVNVSVRDSLSGELIASGAQMIARDGAYVDSMSVPSNRPDLDSFLLHAAGERSGIYTVTVRKLGYREWTRVNVQVDRDVCHVNAVKLTAVMQRS